MIAPLQNSPRIKEPEWFPLAISKRTLIHYDLDFNLVVKSCSANLMGVYLQL